MEAMEAKMAVESLGPENVLGRRAGRRAKVGAGKGIKFG